MPDGESADPKEGLRALRRAGGACARGEDPAASAQLLGVVVAEGWSEHEEIDDGNSRI